MPRTNGCNIASGLLGDVILGPRRAAYAGAQIDRLIGVEQPVVGVELFKRCRLTPIGLCKALNRSNCFGTIELGWRLAVTEVFGIGAAPARSALRRG